MYHSILLISIATMIMSVSGLAQEAGQSQQALQGSPKYFVQTRSRIIPTGGSSIPDSIHRDSIVALQNTYGFIRVDPDREYLRVREGKMNLYFALKSRSLATSRPTENATDSVYMGFPRAPSAPAAYKASDMKLTSLKYFDFGLDTRPLPFTRSNLVLHTADCNSCQRVLESYTKTRNSLGVLKGVGYALFIGGFVANVANEDRTVTPLGGGMMIGGTVLGIVRIGLKSGLKHRLDSVVEEYNRQY